MRSELDNAWRILSNAEAARLDVRAMAHALGDYGSMLDLRGGKSAVGYLREAIQYASRLIGKDRGYLAMVENDLGNVVTRAGDPKEAQRLYRAAVDEYRKADAPGWTPAPVNQKRILDGDSETRHSERPRAMRRGQSDGQSWEA